MRKLFLNDRFVLFIILVNAIIIFIGGFSLNETVRQNLDIADHFITVLFLIELVIKVKEYSFKGFLRSNWNVFDFALIILAVPSLLMFLWGSQMIGLEFLLLFRIIRVFKFFRFIKFIPRIDHIIKGVYRASKASLLILFTFFIFNFTASLLSTYLFRHLSPEFFSNPLISFYSTFKIFTVEGWYEIPDSISDNAGDTVGFFTRLYFVIILFIGGIFGLSLVNSIFVDAMVSDNNEEVEKELKLLHEKLDQMIMQKEK
ncbi:ion transporter [Negadavirga shengliensis]|uniref:Ion transporter n=1 Tax=Negadavirga shengliensis TaxID=1389218 RepID=A0ABV9SWR9_9BACT